MNSNLEIGNSFCSNSQPGKQKRYHTSHTDIYLSTNKNSCGHIYIYIYIFFYFLRTPKTCTTISVRQNISTISKTI
ncbi:hypothetical protein FKM82_022482 [Ascaphus truei]